MSIILYLNQRFTVAHQ